LRNIKTNVNSSITNNIVALRVEDPEPESQDRYRPNNYEICMKIDAVREEEMEDDRSEAEKTKEVSASKQEEGSGEFNEDQTMSIKAIVTQINSVNVLPSDTDSIVKGKSSYVIHSDGEFLLDIFECKGDAKVSYSDSLTQLDSSKGKLLESVGISEQKHAVKVSQSQMTFIRVESEHSVVRWLPLNFETDEGTGYLKFAAGDLHYSSKFKNMRVEFQPLQTVKKSKSTVSSV
jgi:hypothetical protein